MATRQQVGRLARRISALEAAKYGTRTAWVWRHTNETQAEALARHHKDRPEDRAATLTYVFSWRNAGHERGE
jgi:hypothetical protein